MSETLPVKPEASVMGTTQSGLINRWFCCRLQTLSDRGAGSLC